jgi:hypothetical protein
MDYTNLINLALVTVIYSTIIAPNIQKLSGLKEDILNVNFPAKVSSPDNEELIKENGVILSKKMAQYTAKYHEIQNFLRYFYAILGIVTSYQTYLLFTNPFNIVALLTLVTSVLIVLILAFSLHLYMSLPWQVRSFEWLSKGGVAPVYLNHIFNPVFSINVTSRNVIDDDGDVKLSIRSDVGLLGFHYILTVESLDSRYLYYTSAAKATKHHHLSNLVYDNGHQGSEITLGKAKLKTGEYKARLLFMGAPFRGRNKVYETTMDFRVVDGNAAAQREKILLGPQSAKPNYWMILNRKYRLTDIDLTPQPTKADESIERLLAVSLFLKMIKKSKRAFDISEVHGQIDRAFIEKSLTKRHLFNVRVRRLLKKYKSLHL